MAGVGDIENGRVHAHLRFLRVLISTCMLIGLLLSCWLWKTSSQSLLLSTDVDLREIMNELAAHSVRAVSICAILFAKLSLVKNRNICFDHHLIFGMSERALNRK